MTQEEARIIVKEAMKKYSEAARTKCLIVLAVFVVVFGANIGIAAIVSSAGGDITSIAIALNGILAIMFVRIIAPLFVTYSDNKSAVKKIESEPVPDPEVDYVMLVEKYNLLP